MSDSWTLDGFAFRHEIQILPSIINEIRERGEFAFVGPNRAIFSLRVILSCQTQEM